MIAIEIFWAGVVGSIENLKSKLDLFFSNKVRLKNSEQGAIEFFSAGAGWKTSRGLWWGGRGN